ncbi:MAG: translation initiation factor IF-6, partial [Candidatus Heimdallarchaeota archaeon]
MNIIRTSVNGLSTLGAFGLATEKFAIISKIWTDKAEEAITKALEVPVARLDIGDTSLVGILAVANSNGIIVP